ncbi:hypothetical protein N1851_032961 [Merluccius polli]|uniref:Shelterin complex subunit TPP1/Est3 domain-containing protein n=1 Tax=Merluccius polli TaxID=89951 RepID=A0AA47NP39_MERPO|nr:hypothetical protein N1851_032961 [Merluccius polli]
MTRSRTKLEPWIENMIISHGTEKEMNTANLRARVTAVGPMPHSQALEVQGPPELLFLSDGVVQIPAILTDSAWEHLQEEEDRECFSSLVNTTVCLLTYSLQFHVAPEKRKSRFFLSLSKLATMAAGPVKECPPCCTTLSSVRVKICDMWKALQDPSSGHTESQSGIDLTELLGVWQHDCLMDLAEEVQERLTAARRSSSPPQPSTSRDPLALPFGTHARTGWDVDRVRFKGAKPFSIPMAHLIIPDTVAPTPGPPTQPYEGSATPSGLIPPSGDQPVVNSMPAAQPHASTSGHSAKPQDVARAGRGFEETRSPPPFFEVREAMLLEDMDHDTSNPWDRFPPPSKMFCTSSCSEMSNSCAGSRLECEEEMVAVTGTQAPLGGLDHDVSTAATSVESSKGHQSFLPPYQNPAPLHALRFTPTSSRSSPPDSMAQAEPIAVQSSREKTPRLVKEKADVCSKKEPQDASGEVVPTTSSAGVKRKRPEHHHHPPGTAAGPEQEGVPWVDLSPPSWLFESQPGPIPEAGRSSQQAGVAAGGASKPPAVHSDGSRFSYHYKVSWKNTQDLSRFKVADDRLHWAVKYLVTPKQLGSDN